MTLYCRCWENLKRRVKDIETDDKRSMTDNLMTRVEQLTLFIDEQVKNCFLNT